MEAIDDKVYCEVHGDVHDACVRPYDGPPTKRDSDGNPVWLDSHTMEPMPPECTTADWRKLWIGAVLG